MNEAGPWTVLVADKLSPEGLKLLERHPGIVLDVRPGLDENALAEAARGADAILVRSAVKITERVLAGATRLEVIGRAGIGVDNIDVDAATRHGVLVMNSPDANANTTAEHALALLFALARSIPAADASLRAGKWERAKFVGTELAGKTIGVLGGGNIGRRVARKAKALGLDVIVFDPYLAKDALAEDRIPVVTLSELCARADVVTIHVPKTDATANLVDADLLASMKKGVRIVNCARGGIVDEAALAAAIERGHVAGAAIDVFESEPPARDNPLLRSPSVVVTPHLGASTTEAQERASLEICQQVLAYLTDHVIANAVNLPRIRPETLRELAPWIELATRLGQVVAALGAGPHESLEIHYQGHLSAGETSPMTRAVVAAVLSSCSEGPVNWINAPTLAAERGLTVRESRIERVRDFASMITITLSSGTRATTVAGTLFGHRQLRLVRIDEHKLDVIPSGELLLIRNADRPGVVGRVGGLLGTAGVNIRAMHLTPPKDVNGDALIVLNVEPRPTPDLLAQCAALQDVRSATLISLSEGTAP
ncbi:MAG: phosphoglycerate dehydrogenase [Planctomycetes bacterium]|nr:phosphoglycerate dehydrogenase [Planctomycetota bacterium]